MFIVLEGIDGSGKSTACRSIMAYLESAGIKARATVEPTKSDIGRIIMENDDLTPETESLLFTADRACHTEDIKKWLKDGETVVCDRYYASTLAYQAASGVDMQWLEAMNRKVASEPDITFLLDIDPEAALERVCKRGETSRFEHLEYLKRVRANYLRIAEERGFVTVDASRNSGDISRDIINYIKERIGD